MKLTTRTVRIVSLTFRKSTDTCSVVSIFMISSLLFSQNDKKTRVIRNPTVHDGIAGISSLVLEMYSDIKGLFIAGDSKATTDDIKGFLQF